MQEAAGARGTKQLGMNKTVLCTSCTEVRGAAGWHAAGDKCRMVIAAQRTKCACFTVVASAITRGVDQQATTPDRSPPPLPHAV